MSKINQQWIILNHVNGTQRHLTVYIISQQPCLESMIIKPDLNEANYFRILQIIIDCVEDCSIMVDNITKSHISTTPQTIISPCIIKYRHISMVWWLVNVLLAIKCTQKALQRAMDCSPGLATHLLLVVKWKKTKMVQVSWIKPAVPLCTGHPVKCAMVHLK